MGLFSNKSERNIYQYGVQQQLDGRNSAISALNDGQQSGLDALGAGYDQARTQYQKASDLFAPYAQTGQQGLGMYANSLGLNGDAGNTAAQSAFHTSPGFQQRQDLATDAVARQASATGALGSGNTLQGITDRAYALGDQEYSGWQQGLQGLAQMGLSATGSQAGLTKGIGDLDVAQGTGEAGIYQNTAQGVANAYTGAAGNIGNLSQGYMTHADDASKNTWGLLTSGLGSLASGAGYYFGKKS